VKSLYRPLVDRRRLTRYQVWFPVQLASSQLGGLGMTHNVAAGGMLLASSAELAPGERVKVTFAVPPTSTLREHEGRVVRVEDNPADPEGMWPKRIAIEFDKVDDELEVLLEQAVHRVSEIG
jgi:hypothetical protein